MINYPLAACLMIVQAFLFAAEPAIIHKVGLHASTEQLVLLRGIGGIAVVALLARQTGWRVFRTNQFPLQIVRGLVSAFFFAIMMYTYPRLPFADATCLFYTQVVYIAIFSAVLLGEKVTPWKWGAALLSVVGAALILKPAFESWSAVYLLAMLGAALNGAAFVLNKYLQRPGGDSDLTTMLYINIVLTVCAAPMVATNDFVIPDAWLWMIAASLVAGPVGTYLSIVAIRFAPASALGPFTALRLVAALLASVVLFREPMADTSAIGAIVVLVSCLMSTVIPAAGFRRPAIFLRALRQS